MNPPPWFCGPALHGGLYPLLAGLAERPRGGLALPVPRFRSSLEATLNGGPVPQPWGRPRQPGAGHVETHRVPGRTRAKHGVSPVDKARHSTGGLRPANRRSSHPSINYYETSKCKCWIFLSPFSSSRPISVLPPSSDPVPVPVRYSEKERPPHRPDFSGGLNGRDCRTCCQ